MSTIVSLEYHSTIVFHDAWAMGFVHGTMVALSCFQLRATLEASHNFSEEQR